MWVELEAGLLLEQDSADRLEDSDGSGMMRCAASIDRHLGVSGPETGESGSGESEELIEHLRLTRPMQAERMELGGWQGAQPRWIGCGRPDREPDTSDHQWTVVDHETPFGVTIALFHGGAHELPEAAGVVRQEEVIDGVDGTDVKHEGHLRAGGTYDDLRFVRG